MLCPDWSLVNKVFVHYPRQRLNYQKVLIDGIELAFSMTSFNDEQFLTFLNSHPKLIKKPLSSVVVWRHITRFHVMSRDVTLYDVMYTCRYRHVICLALAAAAALQIARDSNNLSYSSLSDQLDCNTECNSCWLPFVWDVLHSRKCSMFEFLPKK